MSRAVAAVVLALTAVFAALTVLPPAQRARAAWVGAGALPGLGNGRIWSVAMNPATPAIVLAGTDSGVYRSEDGGQHWAATALTKGRVWSVGFDVRVPNPAFAALDGGGVRRSDDGGTTWVDASVGLPSKTARTLAFGLELVAVGTADGVAITTDGTSWRPAGLTGYDVSALAVSANAPKPTLIAGIDNTPGTAPGYLFRNVGPTSQWETLSVGTSSAVVSSLSASALPQAPGVRVLLACTNTGMYRSNDGGTVWQKTFPSGSDVAGTTTLTTVAFSPLDPNLVYAGDDAGGSSGGHLLRSTDAGLTFTAADSGLPANKEVAGIAVAPASPPLLVSAVNPPGQPAAVYAETDASAPSPAPTGPPEAVVSLPSVSPPPTVAPTPAPSVGPPPAAGGDNPLARFVRWPLPLAVELLTALAGAYIWMRWRQRRLHIEGPP
jgi:photosystem II stability/assembly factor-like uncharacterized protein